MDRHLWTDLDVKAARRLWAVTTHNLDDPEVLPHHLRELSGEQRISKLPRRTPKHAAPDPDDEEPSQEGVTVSVVYITRQRRRPTTLQVLVLGGMGVAVVTVGYLAVRSLMGAS
jgi:hypothetical protein